METMEKEEHTESRIAPLRLLRSDLKKAATRMSDKEERYLVDLYYQIQDFRKASGNQISQMKKAKEPAGVITWAFDTFDMMEGEIKKALDVYTDVEATGMGLWAKSIFGIGEVISAGLLAHINLEPWKCVKPLRGKAKPCTQRVPHVGSRCGPVPIKTVGAIWRFGGYDPTVRWEKGQKRPWNAQLKTLFWKIGESFVKFQGSPECYYGQLFANKKAEEIKKDDRGDFADQAVEVLRNKNIGKDTDAYPWYHGEYPKGTMAKFQAIPSIPPEKRMEFLKKARQARGERIAMLPPGHIHARSKRWAVKIFLSHWFEEAFRTRYKKDPPMPYVVAILGHTKRYEAPKQPAAKKRRAS